MLRDRIGVSSPRPPSRLLDASVAFGAAGICELLSRFRDELPVVSPVPQRELQNTVSIGIARFAVRRGKQDRPVTLTAGAHHEFANPAARFAHAGRILRS